MWNTNGRVFVSSVLSKLRERERKKRRKRERKKEVRRSYLL